MESLDKEETRISVSPERIDAFLKEQDARHPVRESIETEGGSTAIHIPNGNEVVLTWSSDSPVRLLGRIDARYKWDELGEHEPGTYSLRFPRGNYRDIAINTEGSARIQWRS